MLRSIRSFFAFCSPLNRSRFYRSLGLSLVQALFEVLRIPALAVMLQAVLEGKVTSQTILLSLGIMLVSIIGQSIIKYSATMLQCRAGYTTCADKRIEIAEHMRYLPMGYFNENSLGMITSVATNSMENLANVATRVVMMVSSGAITTAFITLMVAIYDIRIGLIVVAGLVIFYLVNLLLQRKARKVAPKKIRSDAVLVEKVLEYLQGIPEVKSYGLVGMYAHRLNKAIDDNVNINVRMELDFVSVMALQNIISKLIGVAVATVSVLFYLSGTMPLLDCMIMLSTSFMLTLALESMGTYSALLRVVDICVGQANEILDLPPMDIDGEDMEPVSRDLEMKDVGFSYDEKRIIDGVSLRIPEGTTAAFVGPSGGGKTTICSLLSRFWDVDEGEVTLGGRDVRDYSMDALMKNFSFVFQNVTLFKDTVANNIRFGQPEASMDEVIAAAKKAQCHDFIMRLPQGYDTLIGEDGATLSGGERQRISIARAMMKDSPIIILDEATANIDPENEQELMAAIEALTKEKTVIMIAHRLKTVEKADQIFVVKQGQIVQHGTHEDLMAEGGIYRRFVDARKQAIGWTI